MNGRSSSDRTICFYNEHADQYRERTIDLVMEDLYAPFLSRLPGSARILDAGCGPGRDTSAFSDRGHSVVAMDASGAMVALAREHTGIDVLHRSFQEVDWVDEFDGIWACASLLHVPRRELPSVLERLARALKDGGVLYASFKYGVGERVSQGRHFSDFDESGMDAVLEGVSTLRRLELWLSRDARPERVNDVWLNALLQRVD